MKTGENVDKQGKTGRIKEKHSKTGENVEKHGKTGRINEKQKNMGKQEKM